MSEGSITSALASFTDGANGLFIGHSFFVPIAREFNQIASDMNNIFNRPFYPDHEFSEEMSGGESGSPDALWNDPGHFSNIDATLSEGAVELFGMTGYSTIEELQQSYDYYIETGTYPPLEDEYLLQYTQWIDLAHSYNPDTSIYIGIPWVSENDEMDTDTFDTLVEFSCEAVYQTIIATLRSLYPTKEILYICYGKTASIMRQRFDDDNLPDITKLVGSGDNALFSDNNLGHAGPMLTDLCALVWVGLLYGGNSRQLNFYLKNYLTWNQKSAREIVIDVVRFNEAYIA